MAAVTGLLVCTAWYYTILAGFYVLYCPVLYMMFINQRFYRRIADTLFALWELFPVALFQCCCNTQLHHYGDYVDSNENTIIILNHRTRVDWNYAWIGLYHATQNKKDKLQDQTKERDNCKAASEYIDTRLGAHQTVTGVLDRIGGGRAKIKFVLKDEIKTVPGLGWIMQLNFFLYVKRNWREDQLNLSQFVDYYRKMGACGSSDGGGGGCGGYRVVLFPEGSDLSDDNRRRSDRFADAHNLKHLDFVLHPRTTGWAVLCSKLRTAGLASVYDATVAYDAPAQTEADLLRGRLPKNVYFLFKRYSIDQLPTEEEDLRLWLNCKWYEKEVTLKNFHNYGHFLNATDSKPAKRVPRSLRTAKIAFVFWIVIDLLYLYGLLYSMYFQFWVIYHSLLFLFVTYWFGGFHKIQYKVLEMSYNKK